MTRTFNDNLQKWFTGQRLIQSLAFLLVAVIGFTVAQDYLRARLNESAFYLSESLLYTAFWACFWPVGWILVLLHRKLTVPVYVLIPVAVLLHLVLVPLIIWGLSALCFDHTYGFADVWMYTMAEQLYVLLAVYTVLVIGIKYLQKQPAPVSVINPEFVEAEKNTPFLRQITINKGKTSILVDVDNILYISAATPYVCLHLENRKHLYNHSLKNTEFSLDPQQFLRIHKSTIVNLKMVKSYTSRLNGDYDLQLINSEVLRLSRNYRTAFNDRFGK
ncbi:MAG: LytR/AlgR family response regulator transcription factor [Pseudobacter sp.]|uniref:LytR/AlgR family response regulator transcription factor n=1 Tax=Pseudobacter sp. TaxID=2045420 RepID=UPI003F802F13